MTMKQRLIGGVIAILFFLTLCGLLTLASCGPVGVSSAPRTTAMPRITTTPDVIHMLETAAVVEGK